MEEEFKAQKGTFIYKYFKFAYFLNFIWLIMSFLVLLFYSLGVLFSIIYEFREGTLTQSGMLSYVLVVFFAGILPVIIHEAIRRKLRKMERDFLTHLITLYVLLPLVLIIFTLLSLLVLLVTSLLI